MAELSTAQLIAAIGIISQLMIDALLFGLFVLLHRHAESRPWFRAWMLAWGSLALALACVTYSYFGPMPAAWQPWGTWTLQFIYLAGKIAFIVFLLTGFLFYAGALRAFVRLRYVLPASVAYASLAYLFSQGALPTMIWQGIPAVVLFTLAAMVISRLPARRRTLGSQLSGAMFGLMAVLWLIYTIGFAPQLRPLLPEVTGLLRIVARNNAYFDLATHMLLAFGMVLILLEDAKREVDAAHIKLDRAHERLRDQSLRDVLTSCLNRRAFAERAGLELVEIGGTVVVADLDNLKEVNDAHGHQAGDELLKYFAATLRDELRAADSLYRWGGDEFLLVLPEGEADSVVPRLNQHLKEAATCELSDGTKVTLEVSIGAADFHNGGDFEQAIHAADRAMYQQKRARKKRKKMRSV